MINQKEVIIKFSRLIGISEYEARPGFEVFVKQILSKLNFGDQLEIESLGFFSFRKIKTDSTPTYDFNPAVIFSIDKLAQNSKDFLLFFPSEESLRQYPAVDSYLNLSFGKPLVATGRSVDEDSLLPFSSNEIMNLIESKVERLVENSKVYVSMDEQDQEFNITQKSEGAEQTSVEESDVFLQRTEELEDILKEEVLPNSDTQNELSQEKVGQLEDILKEEVLQTNDNASEIIEEKAEEGANLITDPKIIKSFDDFELVELKEITPSGVESEEEVNKTKMFFDDLNLEEEFQETDPNIETKDDHEAVLDNFSKITVNESGEIDSGTLASEVIASETKLKNRRLKRFVFTSLGFLLLGAATVGVYINYNQLKQIIEQYIGEEPQTISVAQKITPQIISRTYEIHVSFSLSKDESLLNFVNDALLISPSIYSMKQGELNKTLSAAITNQANIPLTNSELSKVAENIYQRNSEFIVQISSWKLKSKAIKELDKYVNYGYRCELIEESSANIRKYYRVMVRGFNSFEEADNFLIKNK
jgi:hypothetical protein